MLVRIVGQAPLDATVYELDRLRCNLCGEVFAAPEPEGVASEKYDETNAAMIALLKYASRMSFYRLEKLEQALGIPLAASTQWEIAEDEAELIQAARDKLIRQAAQGECCITTTPAFGCCAWRASRLKGAKPTGTVCLPAALSPHDKDAGSPCTSPAAARRRKSARCASTP